MDAADYADCRLCPRACGADRRAGQHGVCGEGAECRVAHTGLHFGEEPPLSGTRGSGTIFFSGCSSRCFFCQNHQISVEGIGDTVSPEALYHRARQLLDAGAHNLNFVTPDHFWPHAEALARRLRAEGCDAPLVFNGSGYHAPALLRRAAPWIDIFLPDVKFADGALAREAMGDANYPEIALAALDAMIEARGFLEPWDPSGRTPARQGVLVRHLVLPGEVPNSLRALERLREAFGPYLPLSVMSQFRPTPGCVRRGRFTRPVSAGEYTAVREHVRALGFRNVFIQGAPEADAPYLPDFARAVPFAAHAQDRATDTSSPEAFPSSSRPSSSRSTTTATTAVDDGTHRRRNP